MDNTVPWLTLRLFGSFEATIYGAPLPRMRTRKGQWLLALLALRCGEELDRDWLAYLLWPDSPATTALSNLRGSIKDLRRALGSEAGRLRSPTTRTLSLELADAVVDARAFDAAVLRGNTASLEEAVSLYRGPLLEGCAEEWVFQGRSQREQAYLGALEALARHAQTRRDLAAAERHLRQAVAADPLRETAQRALMEILAAGGNYGAALLTYRELRLRLHREVSAEPDPETAALFQRIRREARSVPTPTRGEAFSAMRESLGRHDTGLHDLRLERTAPVVALDLPALVPSVQTLDTRPHNLPVQREPLIGREQELAALRRLLRDETVGLVTVTGPGGAGKTRLALQAAADRLDQFEDGVFFVNLAPVREPDRVVSTIAQTLGIRERKGQPLPESLREHLRQQQLLLLLDNFEQVVEAAPVIANLLSSCPRLKVLATSRARLQLRGEREFAVPPLTLPDRKHLPAAAALSQVAAVALFIERASAVRSDFAVTNENASAVAEICHRLDGLPLAIELAATRIKLFPPQALLSRLHSRLRLLVGGSRDLPARQQTLRNTIAWSHDLLTGREKTLFHRLAVFVGGCTLEAVEAVCSADDASLDILEGIASLVEKNLLRHEEQPDGESRFGMLETIREFAWEQLRAAGEMEATRRRHALLFLALAEEAERERHSAQQGRWLDRLQAEHDNLRAALAWAREQGEAELGLRLAGALEFFWDMRGHWTEGRDLLRQLLALPAPGCSAGRGSALGAAGHLAFRQGDLEAARALWEESLTVHRELGDRLGMASSLHNLGRVIRDQGEPEAGRRLIEEAVAICRELGERRLLAASLNSLANLLSHTGNYDRARALYEESVAVSRELGDPFKIGMAQGNLAKMLFHALGEHGEAKRLQEENLRNLRALGAVEHIANVVDFLGDVALAEEEYEAARAHHEESLQIRRELGNRGTIIYSLNSLGEACRCLGEFERARALHREALELARELGCALQIEMHIADGLQDLGGVFIMEGRPEVGVRLISQSFAIHAARQNDPPVFRRADRERLLAAARAALGEEAFAAAWAEGQAMSPGDAVELALLER